MSRLLTVEQAAERLAVHRKTVYRMVKAGTIGHVRIGGVIRIPESALEQLIAEHLVEVSA